MKKSSALLLLFLSSLAYGQVTDPFPYKFSSSIYERIKTDSASWRGGVTSSDLSFIGLYKEALEEWDKPRRSLRSIPSTDSIDFVSNYKPVDAIPFILSKAKNTRVIIFNEAHYNPRNRVFVTALLKDLKKSGYSHFAAETFSTRESFPSNSKYPNLNTGYYAMEPQFGNLIREANLLSYTLYPYESPTGGDVNAREDRQAKKLADLLNKDTSVRLLVFCGFDHVMEDSVLNWGLPMAARLKALTGIDPYTIDQIVLSERSSPALHNPYYRLIKADRYSIMEDAHGNAFNKLPNNKKVDALLFSPATRYIYNRPDWVFENGKEPYHLKKEDITVTYPLLAKVYFSEADIDNMVIPVDIIEIRKEEDVTVTALAVYKGRDFIVQLIDTKGSMQVLRR